MKSAANRHILEISGMTCHACFERVYLILKRIPGVCTQSVAMGGATITCNGFVELRAACESLGAAGYPTHNTDIFAVDPEACSTWADEQTP
jgi:copper chaperone CopZ